jgi:hypothetical protein
MKMGRRNYAWHAHRMHQRTLQLQKQLKGARQEMHRWKTMHSDAKWALHELSNGFGNQAIELYRAGELQDRIPYKTRDKIGGIVWGAAAAMKESLQ